MSAILQSNKPRLTTSYSFPKLPAVGRWNTLAITPAPHSNGASSVSSVSTKSRARNIDREEPCFITKSVSYTHERAHWVNAVRKDSVLKEQVENLLYDRRIVVVDFALDDTTNLTNMDCSLHAALDKYAFFAVTASLHSLNQLIELLEKNNSYRQGIYDELRQDPGRFINLSSPPVSDVQYQLVVLRPEHFLPDHSVLTVYDRANGQVSTKTYMIGPDRALRRSPANDVNACEAFPSFAFDYNRSRSFPLNPFLVILNAEIKFRRYLREIPSPTLPDGVVELMHKTIYLVELIYWDPVNRPGTRAALSMEIDEVPKVPQSADIDMGEMGTRDDDEYDIPTVRRSDIPSVRRRRPPGPGATLEERRDFGQYLLSGRDTDSEDEFSEEEEYDLDDYEALNPAPLTDKIHNWQRTTEAI